MAGDVFVELIAQRVPLKRVARTHGGEWHGPCPRCGGRDRFFVNPAIDRATCRQCRWSGDEIQYRRDVLRQSFVEAARAAGKGLDHHVQYRRPEVSLPPCEPPAAAWREAGLQFVAWAREQLWSDAGAAMRRYLHGRGLSDETILHAQLGFNPATLHRNAVRWGLECTHYRSQWLPAGLVIPSLVGGGLWKITIRQNQPDRARQRYIAVAGSANPLYNADTISVERPVMLVEGVLDALAVQQVAGDLVASVATGTTSGRRLCWIMRLGLAPLALLSHDHDGQPGETAAAYWRDVLAPRAMRWPPIGAKDPAAMLEVGLDVRSWVRAGLAYAGSLQVQCC